MTFKVKDGLQVGNNTFVNANLDVNANNISVSNTVSIGGGKVNSSFFTGTANNALYAFNGKSESSLNANSALYANQANYANIANTALYAYNGKAETALNANSATYSTNAQFAYTANVAKYLNGKAESALAANSSLYANYATYAGIANTALYAYNGKAETSLNANSATYATNAQFAYTANVANYLNGKAESALAANSALYANYATYAGIANAALYSYGGKSETSLNANSATYATNAQFAYTANSANYLNGVAPSALSTNSALYANYATYAGIANAALYSYGGKSETSLNANSATYATNAQFSYTANVANYLNGKAESALAANSATYATNAQFAYTANSALYANIANYLNGKAESALAANSALYANVANYLNGKAESALAANSALYANVANYLNGKAESALNANTAQYLGGFNSAYYTNANNISTGTLAEARLPFRMDQNLRTTDSVTFANGSFTGNITVGGDLILSGNLYSTNVQSLSVLDPMIKLGANNSADTLWSGFVTHYSGSGYTNNHTGLVRNPSTKEYILMSTYADEASVNNNIIVITDPSFTYANLAVNSIKLGNGTVFSTIGVGSYSGTANNATYVYGKQESQLSVANAVFSTTANNSLYLNGKQESQLSVSYSNTSNSSLFSNNTNYLNGLTSSYFTNATNISTGTLPWNVLPQGSVNTSSSVSVSNTWTFQDIIINGGVKANGTFGSTDQVLASNGSGGIYWKQDQGAIYYYQSVANTTVGVMRLYNANNVNNDVVLVGNGTAKVFSNSSYVVIDTQDQFVGTVTSVDGGSGLVGGPFTDSGILYVGAGAGISVNTDDVAVNAKDGLVANSSGLYVNTAYFTLLSSSVSSNNALSLQFKTWEEPASIGNTTPNDGKFVALQANTLYVKTNIVANDYIFLGNTTVINSTYFAATSNNSYRAFGKNENQLNVNSSLYTSASNNASYLQGYTWESPAAIGAITANTGKFVYANVTSHIAFASVAHMMGLGKITVSGMTPANIIEFSTGTYTGGKLIIEVTDTHNNFRHISEILLSHDGTNVVATEYGVIQTGNTALATFNIDILSGNVRILATPVSSNTTTFKIIQNLFLA